MTVRFCRNCGRLNREDFSYCPYCGEALPLGPGMEEALEGPFRRLEERSLRDLSAEERVARAMAALRTRLDELESDMDEILAARGAGASTRHDPD
jgi:hypothetical protein